MCLAIPMRIIAIEGDRASCEAGGIERDVDLYLLADDLPSPGDHVLVHVGYAIRKVDATLAREARLLHDSAEGQ